MIKFLTTLSVFALIVQLVLSHLRVERSLETRLYILENLIDSKSKMDNKELEVKVNEVYNIINGK